MVTDIFGVEVVVGDCILYAMSLGRGAVLKKYEVVSIEKTDRLYTTEYKVRAKLVHSPIQWDGQSYGRESTLHGELFSERAVKCDE